MASTGEFTFEQICDRYEHCYSYLDYARAVLMKFDGVVAIGIGPKQTDYKLDPEQTCYVVFVKNKKPAIELKATDLIPKDLLGIKTDVVQIGSRMLSIHNEFDARWYRSRMIQ